MSSILDELCPIYVGARAFDLSLTYPDLTPQAFTAVEITVDYSDCDPEDPVLPLEMLVTSPSSELFVRKVFRRTVPATLFFTPLEGGRHVVVLREVGHNLWRGALTIDVQGDEIP